MPAALLLSLEKQRANLLKKEDTLFNRRAMEILVGPTEIFDFGEDSLCEFILLVEEFVVGRSDVIDFLIFRLLLAVEKALDAARSQGRSPPIAIDLCKTGSRFADLFLELARLFEARNHPKLVFNR